MSSKTVPLSVRISHDDAEYIAGLKIDDALTPSDKVRAIIRDARKAREARTMRAFSKSRRGAWFP